MRYCLPVFMVSTPRGPGRFRRQTLTPRQIRSELVLRGIKNADIARALGVTRSAVSNTIAGRRRKPRIRQAIALAISRSVENIWPSEPETKFTTGKGAGNG